MTDAQVALSTDDYQALAGMLMSEDADVRSQGQWLAKKLTPAEQQSFFDVQKEMHRGAPERVDHVIADGIPLIGSISPEMAVASGVPIARAAVGGLAAAASAVGSQVVTQGKYWATKLALEHLGVPSVMAEAAAAAVSSRSGGKGGAKGEPASPQASAADAPHLDLSKPMRPGSLSTAQMAEREAAVAANGGLNFQMPRRGGDGRPVKPVSARVAPDGPAAEPVASAPVVPEPQPVPSARTAAPPPTAESTPSAPTNSLPDQRALNEEALARRRAEYQARVAAEPPSAPTKFVPTPLEMKEYLRLIKAGKTHAEAGQAIVAQRELATRYGLTTPTVDDTKFPKGMRGKTP